MRLPRRSTGLKKESVANVYDLQKVLRSDLITRVGTLAAGDLEALDAGLRLVLEL